MGGIDDDYRKPVLVSAHGDHYEWGCMIGEAERDSIQGAVETLGELPVFRMHQPWWLPYSFYLSYSESVARGVLEGVVNSMFPHYRARLEGMAAGAGVRLDTLFLFHMLESACNSHQDGEVYDAPQGGCTAIGIAPDCVIENEPVVLHNLDQVPQAAPHLTVRESQSPGELRSLSMTLSPLCGVVDGMNEAGLAISYNYAAATDVEPKGTPVSLSISDALANCRSVEDAVRNITRRPRSHGAMLMIADAAGTVARLELSGHSYHVEMESDPKGILFHSNSYRSDPMLERQVKQEAVYGNSCPEALRGTRVLESSEMRDGRLMEMVNRDGRFDVDDALTLLTDHGTDCLPGANTICMHGPYWSTIASVRLLPKSRTMSVAYSPACSADYVHFTL